MSSISPTVWNGLRRKFQDMAYGIINKFVTIYAIPREEDELGYTSKGNGIYLAYDHPILDKIHGESKRTAFVTGVFAHELNHKIQTPFLEFEQTLHKLPVRQHKIFHDLYNRMEDIAIEDQAAQYIGGTLLDCLHYTSMTLYKLAEPLQPDYPLVQFLNAVTMYGDGGAIKGEFTSDKAREVFHKALPIIDKTSVEPDGRIRIQNAYEVFLIAKPLWDPVLKSEALYEKIMKALESAAKAQGKGTSGTGDSAMDIPPDKSATDPATDKRKKRRKITFKRISKEEMEARRKNASPGGADDGTSDLEVLYCDEPAPPETPTEGVQGPQESIGAPKANIDPSERNASSGAPEDARGASDDVDFSFDPDYEKEATIDDEEYELPPETLDRIEQILETVKQEATAEKTARDECYSEDLSESAAIKACYDGARCLNKRVKSNLSDTLNAKYNTLLQLLSEGINFLVNHMKRIIKKDTEDREYRNSGKLNVKRLSSGRLTSRVFNRRFDPANTSDMCVEILVDESGSMQSDSKSTCAMQCVVGLAEAFSRLRIPLKVIGYTADIGGYDAVHYHYMHWLNTPAERANLLSITHRCDNFDGYSIRYGTEMLLKRKERHKIMIIISDGHPAALYYRSRAAGIEDTIDAIKQARKKVDVIGVGVGSANTAVWEAMYGSDFVHVKNANDLFKRIGYEIQKKMKKWE